MKKRLRKLARSLRRSLTPISPQKLLDAFEILGMNGDAPAIVVHSSMSRCGKLAGGPCALLGALTARYPNVVAPTHTQPMPSSPGGPIPVFDPGSSPSIVGLFSKTLRQQPSAIRSWHPSHSIAAIGSEAAELCSGHEMSDRPCGAQTPYQKLIDMQAAALMYGVPLTYYTLFHRAEDAAEVPYLYFPERVPMRYRTPEEEVVTIESWRQDWTQPRRFAAMEAELVQAGLLRRCPLGRGSLLYIPDVSEVHQYTVNKLKENAHYLLAE